MFFCRHSASTGTLALYVEIGAVTSCDAQHGTAHAFPLTHQVFQAAAHSLTKEMSLCTLHDFILAFETSSDSHLQRLTLLCIWQGEHCHGFGPGIFFFLRGDVSRFFNMLSQSIHISEGCFLTALRVKQWRKQAREIPSIMIKWFQKGTNYKNPQK